MSTREIADEIMWPAVGKVAPAIYREMVDARGDILTEEKHEEKHRLPE
jgi:hypothetical protein